MASLNKRLVAKLETKDNIEEFRQALESVSDKIVAAADLLGEVWESLGQLPALEVEIIEPKLRFEDKIDKNEATGVIGIYSVTYDFEDHVVVKEEYVTRSLREYSGKAARHTEWGAIERAGVAWAYGESTHGFAKALEYALGAISRRGFYTPEAGD